MCQAHYVYSTEYIYLELTKTTRELRSSLNAMARTAISSFLLFLSLALHLLSSMQSSEQSFIAPSVDEKEHVEEVRCGAAQESRTG